MDDGERRLCELLTPFVHPHLLGEVPSCDVVKDCSAPAVTLLVGGTPACEEHAA